MHIYGQLFFNIKFNSNLWIVEITAIKKYDIRNINKIKTIIR